MKKIIFLSLIFFCFIQAEKRKPLKVLHVTLHEGCKNEFIGVANALGLDLTSWFVQELERVVAPGFWEGTYVANEVYNVGPRRAKRVWDKHKDFFNQFDVIVTSDTVPLSRIFLQNGWEKPLIIWICNRFDYAHAGGGEDRFPDAAYYDLMRKAATMKNVRFVAYTEYEHEYARRKGIEVGRRVIKPACSQEGKPRSYVSHVPSHINKPETLFIFPRIAPAQRNNVINILASKGIKAWSADEVCTSEIKEFKGVIYFPYNLSTLALFNHTMQGIVRFVPTKQFLLSTGFVWDQNLRNNLNMCEFYQDEFKDILIYFDSWDDLKRKIETTDYEAVKRKNIEFGQQYRDIMLGKWNDIFNGFVE